MPPSSVVAPLHGRYVMDADVPRVAPLVAPPTSLPAVWEGVPLSFNVSPAACPYLPPPYDSSADVLTTTITLHPACATLLSPAVLTFVAANATAAAAMSLWAYNGSANATAPSTAAMSLCAYNCSAPNALHRHVTAAPGSSQPPPPPTVVAVPGRCWCHPPVCRWWRAAG